MRNPAGVAGPLVEGDWVEAKELDLAVLSVCPSVQWSSWIEGGSFEVL